MFDELDEMTNHFVKLIRISSFVQQMGKEMFDELDEMTTFTDYVNATYMDYVSGDTGVRNLAKDLLMYKIGK